MASSGNKRNFDFKMSKKVAELTQVVHMLFTRNHEKEVECDALRAAYEEEIRHVIQDATSKIQTLDTRIQQLELEKHKQTEDTELRLQGECQKREAELQGRIQELETQLLEEKKESQTSRDLLIRTQKDVHDLRQAHSQEVTSLTRLSEDKEREIVRLKKTLVNLEHEVLDKDSLLDSKGELLRTHEKLRREVDQMRETLKESDRVREELSNKGRRLEGEVKALRKELAKRGGNERLSAKSKLPNLSPTVEETEEVENLRRELLKYKLELYNRENNFNRMFSEKQPIMADMAVSRFSPHGRGVVHHDVTNGAMRLNRERTYAGETHTEHVKDIESARHTVSATGRPGRPAAGHSNHSNHSSHSNHSLPHLTDRIHRLTKPKPLPRELLTGKTTAR